MFCDECGKRIEVGERFIPFPEKNFHADCFEENHLLPLLNIAVQRLGGGVLPSGRVRLNLDKVAQNQHILETGPRVCPFMSRRISIARFGDSFERLVAQPCIGIRCEVWEGSVCSVLAAAKPVTRLILTPEVEVTPDEVKAILEATAGAGIPISVEVPDDARDFVDAVDKAAEYTDRELRDLGEG